MSKQHGIALIRRWSDPAYRARQVATLRRNAEERRGQKRPRPTLKVPRRPARREDKADQ